MKSVGILVVLILALLRVSTASAAPATMSFVPTFSNSALGEGGTFTAAFTFSGTAYYGEPEPISKVTVNLPAGVGESASGFSTCTRETLEEEGIKYCPPSSLAGPEGSITLATVLQSKEPPFEETGSIQAVFAPEGQLYFFIDIQSPVTYEVVLNSSYVAGVLTLEIPKLESVPGAPDFSITALTLQFGATREEEGTPLYSFTLPEQCPAGGKFAWSADIGLYENGTPLHGAAETSCAGSSSKRPTTTTLQTSTTSPATSETVTYTATVLPKTPGGTEPSGSVQFRDEGAAIGTCSAQPLTPGTSSSAATCTLSYTTAGSHHITAKYAGDSNFTGSFSSAQTVTVHAGAAGSGSSTSGAGTTGATGSVSLDGTKIAVQSNHKAAVKLTCTGTATCSGKLTLTVKSTTKKGKKKHTKTQTIGTATFSIPAGQSQTVMVALSKPGRTLLSAAHGNLAATLMVQKSSPSPTQNSSSNVHLAQQKTTKKKK